MYLGIPRKGVHLGDVGHIVDGTDLRKTVSRNEDRGGKGEGERRVK